MDGGGCFIPWMDKRSTDLCSSTPGQDDHGQLEKIK